MMIYRGKVKWFDDKNSCVNCGKEYYKGKGVPEGKYECCCSRECWLEFNGVAEEDISLKEIDITVGDYLND